MEEKFNRQVDREQYITNNNRFIIIQLLIWLLVLLAMFSCLWRNDFNVLLGLMLILTLNRKFRENPKFYCKSIIHLLIAFMIFDIIWMIIIFPYWYDSSNEKLYSNLEKSLHGWVTFFSVLELIDKGIIAFLFIPVYNNYDAFKSLFNFKYN